MTLKIHTDLQGRLSVVWRDPYEWVDPFAEAEHWALVAEENYRRAKAELDDERRHFERVEAHLNGVIQRQHESMMNHAMLHAPPLIVKKDTL